MEVEGSSYIQNKTKRRQIIIKAQEMPQREWKEGIITVLEDKTGNQKGRG